MKKENKINKTIRKHKQRTKMLLHDANGRQAGDGAAIFDCHEMQESLHDDFVHNLLLSMWDADALQPRIEEPIAKTDWPRNRHARRTKNT